jgi:cation transport ATPase
VFIIIPLPRGLDRKLKKALKNGELSVDEVKLVKSKVDEHHRKLKKGLKLAIIIMAVVMVLLLATSVPHIANGTVLFITMFSTVVIMALTLVIVKFLYIDLMKNQFNKAVRKGYPKISFE